jgi:hypothetical protein
MEGYAAGKMNNPRHATICLSFGQLTKLAYTRRMPKATHTP